MSNIHCEIHFEEEIVEHLTKQGWLEGDQKNYVPELALYPEDAVEWVKETQPKAWEKLEATHGIDGARAAFLKRLVAELDSHGSLSILRHGFKDRGTSIDMCQFRPAQGLNVEIWTHYKAVRCRVVRQVHYSPFRTAESIDLVLFVNGIPVATCELKTDSTQSASAAIKQYRNDRPVKDLATRKSEPLLQFKTRCVVHFAASTTEVWMTTRLDGKATHFLPFNLGNNGGKGNPVNPNGHMTAYLWEHVWQRDNWLYILGRFVHLETKDKEIEDGKTVKVENIIFPRFHQWDCVKKLIDAAQVEKAGGKYLVQHSAGSGKSNSIAWLAHQLASLHDGQDQKVFDSVIVITDRTILDKQLQDTIFQFEHKHGVVECITNEKDAKSDKLAKALLDRKPIIIVTIQTFSYLIKKIQKETSLKDRSFAVIADEAHTSQTGSAARDLKEVLGTEAPDPDEEVSVEDMLAAQMSNRLQPKNVSYFAFTATPKPKTLELFGRKTGPKDALEPFHGYTMQQAIEEEFILDVLQNYTSYKVAWKLAHGGKEYDSNSEVDEANAMKALVRWVKLHPVNIAQKVAIIVEHFRQHIAWRLDHQAKAMVVTESRLEAVKFKLEIDRYIKANGYKIGTLVAFSGDVRNDAEPNKPFTETNMNTGLRGRSIPKSFDADEYQVLLVANKYQTGFDQKKLVAMYVNKRLSGVSTVQTLSRLNRVMHPKKDSTFVLDFVNDPEEILADFQVYYRTASLNPTTDPNKIHDLERKLDEMGLYLESEVEAFAQFYFRDKSQQKNSELLKLLQPPLDRFRIGLRDARKFKDTEGIDALNLFVKDMQSFVRMYDFLSQLFDYGDTALEKRYVFYKELIPLLRNLLREDNLDTPIDLNDVKLTHLNVRNKGQVELTLDPNQDTVLEPIDGVGTGKAKERKLALLSEIIQRLNDLFEGELTEDDLVNYAYSIRDKLLENDSLAVEAANNEKDRFAKGSFHKALMDAVLAQRKVNSSMSAQVLSSPKVLEGFVTLMVDLAYEGFAQRRVDAREENDAAIH